MNWAATRPCDSLIRIVSCLNALAGSVGLRLLSMVWTFALSADAMVVSQTAVSLRIKRLEPDPGVLM